MSKPKTKLLCSVDCPHCNNKVNILKETEVIVPAQKAEKKERYFAEKPKQKTLD